MSSGEVFRLFRFPVALRVFKSLVFVKHTLVEKCSLVAVSLASVSPSKLAAGAVLEIKVQHCFAAFAGRTSHQD